MRLIARLIVIAVIAAFAAGSIVHAAGSAIMTADMITKKVDLIDTKIDLIEMSGCDNCDGADGFASGLTCDFVCSGSGFMFAFIPETTNITLRSGENLKFPAPRTLQNLAYSPEKHPPRNII